MNTVSFMTANYVAREVGYNMTGGWGQGDKAAQAYFRPIETFAERFEALLDEIAGLGFDTIDLWSGHLNPSWATPAHIETARDLLAKFGFEVISLAGGFGTTAEEFAQTCALATALNCRILGGTTGLLATDRAAAIALLEQHDLVLGVENHPEKNPAELLAKIGDGAGGRVGACIDTGWFGTQGYDAAQAIEELADVLIHVHLKDVLAEGAHDTCAYGEGVVPVEGCVRALQRIGYTGGISVEHEPEQANPNDDIVRSAEMLRGWLEG